MEALGVAASIIAVLQISSQVINICTKYIEAFDDAPKDLRLILIEISALKGLFEPLKILVGFDSETAMLDTMLLAPVDGCLKAVNELEVLLCPAEKPDSSGVGSGSDDRGSSRYHGNKRQRVVSLLVRLAWPLKQEKAKRLLDLIGVYKNTINLLLTSHGM
jgi:hypothetical protein